MLPPLVDRSLRRSLHRSTPAMKDEVQQAVSPLIAPHATDPGLAEGDFITSKAIPLALSAAGVALVVPGVVKMALGIHE